MTRTAALAAALLCTVPPAPAFAQAGAARAAFEPGRLPGTIESVAIHPVTAGAVTCTDHAAFEGDPVMLGDALGRDCTVVRHDAGPAGRFARAYAGDGTSNEDWFGWGEPLLAPFDGVVEKVYRNPVTNRPGEPGEPPASHIVFARADGLRVVYAHVRDPLVEVGDTVGAGQPVARIGNNGFGYMPHVHVGAWRGDQPLQLRFDPLAAGRLRMAAARKAGR